MNSRDITQADRDSAADFFLAAYKTDSAGLEASLLRTGKLDAKPLVQAFAKHRISAISQARIEERETILKLESYCYGLETLANKPRPPEIISLFEVALKSGDHLIPVSDDRDD